MKSLLMVRTYPQGTVMEQYSKKIELYRDIECVVRTTHIEKDLIIKFFWRFLILYLLLILYRVGFIYGRFNNYNKLDLIEIYSNGIEFHQLVRIEIYDILWYFMVHAFYFNFFQLEDAIRSWLNSWIYLLNIMFHIL